MIEERPDLDPDCRMLIDAKQRGTRSETVVNRYGPGFVSMFAGAGGGMVVAETYTKAGYIKAIPKILSFALIGLIAGEMYYSYKEKGKMRADYQYYHYMTLHPEDFAPKERVKYRDYLTSWVPIR